MSDNKIANALLGGQPTSLTYAGYGRCPECGDESAEFWRDDDTGKVFMRCPYFMCDRWGKLTEVDA